MNATLDTVTSAAIGSARDSAGIHATPLARAASAQASLRLAELLGDFAPPPSAHGLARQPWMHSYLPAPGTSTTFRIHG